MFTYQRLDKEEKYLFAIGFGKIAVGTVSLPFFSFFFCVIWSLLYYFQESTSTHCRVANYLPSISAAIGRQPQAFIWQLAIILHAIPRFAISYMYFNYYNKVIRKNRRILAFIACIINVIENFALIGLTLWTSVDSYEIHKKSFITFIIASESYMFLSYFLNKNARRSGTLTKVELKSLRLKKYLAMINIVSMGLAGYFFKRHNDDCEPGVYTLFAFFEYIVVLTNMGYHMTAYYDFSGSTLTFDWINGLNLQKDFMAI